MPTATLTILLAILSQTSALSNPPQLNNPTTIQQQQTKPTNSVTTRPQRRRRAKPQTNATITQKQQRIADAQIRKYRGRADGTIEMLDAQGHVLEVYPENHFMLLMPSAESLERLESERQAQREHANLRRQRVNQRRLERIAAAEGAAQAREDAKLERKKSAAQAAREASAIKLLDRKTGKYIKAIPAKGNKATGGTDDPATVRLWDARRHRYIRAVPLNPPQE